jgi:hypothetical protein
VPHGLSRGSRPKPVGRSFNSRIGEAGSHFTFQLIEKSRHAWLCGLGELDSAASASAISRRIISATGRTSLRRSDLPSRLSRRAGPPALSTSSQPTSNQAIRDCDAPPRAWRSVHRRKGRAQRAQVRAVAGHARQRAIAWRAEQIALLLTATLRSERSGQAGPGDPPFVVVSCLSSASPMHPLCCRKCEADRDRPDKSPLRDFVNVSLR